MGMNIKSILSWNDWPRNSPTRPARTLTSAIQGALEEKPQRVRRERDVEENPPRRGASGSNSATTARRDQRPFRSL